MLDGARLFARPTYDGLEKSLPATLYPRSARSPCRRAVIPAPLEGILACGALLLASARRDRYSRAPYGALEGVLACGALLSLHSESLRSDSVPAALMLAPLEGILARGADARFARPILAPFGRSKLV